MATTSPNPGWLHELSKALAELRQPTDESSPRCPSLDDLAQLLIETFSLPADRLRELAATHPPPASWLEETADPFTAEDS